MGSCNTTQKELGGKDLLLRTCIEKTYATTDTSDSITSTAHGLVVGDIVKPSSIGTLTSIDVNTFYFVINVPDANSFKIATLPSGTAIVMDDTTTGLKLDAFVLVGGLRSKSFSFSSESIDITNQESGEWKTMLDGSGMRSVSMSGSGVYTAEVAFREVRQAFLDNKLICFMFQDAKNNELIEGCFKISSLEVSGDYDAEGQYSIGADSSGPVVFFQAA